MHRPRFFALALAGLLFFACMGSAWAAEEPLPAVSSELTTETGEAPLPEPEPPSDLPEEPALPAPESAGNEGELLDWLKAHKATGGALTLTADITITQFAELPFTAPVTIDCGEFRLFVAHNFSLMGLIVVKGIGSDEGLVRILPGGMLSLDFGATVQAEGGVAVWQEEGAAFFNGPNPMTGEVLTNVHYAQTPMIVWFDSGNDTLIAVPRGGDYEELLPKEKKATVNQNGENIVNAVLPLQWDTAAAEESLAAKTRTTLTGSYEPHAMLSTVAPPSCTVVFRERAVSFQRFSIRGTDAYTPMLLSCFLPSRPLDLTLAYSFDGETWTPLLQQTHDGTEEIGDFQPTLIRENGYTQALTEGEILWPPDSQADTLRFVIHYEDNGETLYSDVICFDGDTFTPGEDYDGNRGGGGELDGGDSLPPPPSDPPHENEDSTTDTGDSGEEASDDTVVITPPPDEAEGNTDEPLIVPEPTPPPVESPSQLPEPILPTVPSPVQTLLPPAQTPPPAIPPAVTAPSSVAETPVPDSTPTVTPSADTSPVETPVQPVDPTPSQPEAMVALSSEEDIPPAVTAVPDAVPLAQPLQIILGGLLTLGVLAAFVCYGKKR